MDCTSLCTVVAQQASHTATLAAAQPEGSTLWAGAAALSLLVAAGAMWADRMQQRRQRVEVDV